jgi:hypothetical protein
LALGTDNKANRSKKGNADSIIRKKIALLQKNNVLEDLSVADIIAVADDLNENLAEEH